MTTEQESEIIRLRKLGYSRNEISKKLHIGHTKVQEVISNHGLSGKQGVDYRKKELREKVKKKHKKVRKTKKYTEPEISGEISTELKPKTKTKRVKKEFMFYGYIRAKIQQGFLYLTISLSTKWTEDIEYATKMLYEKCAELSKKYRVKIIYSAIVKVFYTVKNNKIHVLDRKEYIDMTKHIESCIKLYQKNRW